MNYLEVKDLFEKKMQEACDSIKNAVNGDKIDIQTNFYYVDDKLVEKQTYNGKEKTSLVVSATVFIKGATSEEDPSYEISLLCDINGGEVSDPMLLEDELNNFDAELTRFTTALESAPDVEALIREENERIDLEGDKMAEELEATLAKMKKIGFIGGLIIFGSLFIFRIIKFFI